MSLVVACILISFTGCGGGDDDSSANTLTGSWNFVDPGGKKDTMHLTQTGSSLTGHTDRGGTILGGGANGSSCSIKISSPNYLIWVQGSFNSDTITGTTRYGPFIATRIGTSGGDNGNSDDNGGSLQPVNNQDITLSQYNAINLGMSYNAVCDILGNPDSTTNTGGGTQTYYRNRNLTSVFVYFVNGIVAGNPYKLGGVRSQPGQIATVYNNNILEYHSY